MSNMVVNTNILSLNAHRNLSKIGIMQSKASSRLSSGLRVNSAADDAAGLAISEKMRAQIRGLDMATKNTQDAISLIQTAEGGLQEIDNMAQRIRELIVQAANDTNQEEDRLKISQEIQHLLDEINDMSDRVEFNEKVLLNGEYKAGATTLGFQVGANATQLIDLNIESVKTDDLATVGDFSALATDILGATAGAISDLLLTADEGIRTVINERAKLGAIQNRLEYTMNSLKISSENLSAAESRIRDTDMAKEMMNLTRANILQQAATSMLAQANQAPQSVLQLLQ